MNVQVNDSTLKDKLHETTLERFIYGSSTYGLTNEASDNDYVSIIQTNDFFANSYVWTNDTYQVKEGSDDTTFTTLSLFVRNLINTNSTINFEIIHTESAKSSDLLGFFNERKNWFYNFTTIRAFLGLARRDIKCALENGKRFSHAVRCYYAALNLYDNRTYTNDYRESDPDIHKILFDLKFGSHGLSSKDYGDLVRGYRSKIESLRERVSNSFSSGDTDFKRFMTSSRLKEIDEYVIDRNLKYYYNGCCEAFMSDLIYDSLENGIQY